MILLVVVLTAVTVAVSWSTRRPGATPEWHRRRLVAGMLLTVLGLVAWGAVRVANDGSVPSTADASRAAGHSTLDRTGLDRTGQAAEDRNHRRLPILGDVVAWPAPLPFASTLGIPDLMIIAGFAVAASGRRRPSVVATHHDDRGTPTQTLVLSDGRLWCEAPDHDGSPIEVRLPQVAGGDGSVRARRARMGIEVTAQGGVIIVVDGVAEVAIDGAGRRRPLIVHGTGAARR